jgi:uncharacterized protein YjlB
LSTPYLKKTPEKNKTSRTSNQENNWVFYQNDFDHFHEKGYEILRVTKNRSGIVFSSGETKRS